ncbi:hypothetical protein PC116_g22547 [Phytophthora cactorum]|nr:hypothetical protein Pcac1_g18447 [Phytophthora cactorum]KAG2805693.1 hypothetical protein PC111_g17699 [Phytophthora cactorum]KAG2843735.1 hypothetical protein PC113_g18551 [Phytophthora cactorum]KAG2895052.1 hypothetical protein PC115_g17974 [Phytophthora cactorum]KAG2907833.1 hypothetical protein PC117_g20115 [Phytophthora cactorum]
MRQSSESPAPAPVVLGASVSSSNLSAAPRKVRLSDRELFARVQRVAVPDGSVDLRRLSSKRGWRRVRTGVTGGMEMQYRVLRASTSVAPTQTRQCQVVVGGEIKARTSELLSLLRAPTESESNALLRALYGSQFIYSSLLHAIPNSEQGSLPSPPQRGSIHASTGQQLMVRTVSFAHKGLSNPFKQRASTATSSDSITSDSRSSNHRQQNSGRKNEQCCFIDLLTPTQEGFRLAFCTLDTSEVTAGKAPPERVIALHPISGWLTAEPKPGNPGTLEITFQAAFPGNLPGGCDWRVAQARLLFIGRGICRLEKVLRRKRRFRRHQHTAPGRWWQAILNPFRAMGVVGSDEEGSGGTHHNWHCIACTRSFLPTLRKKWSRCDLCAYRICAEPPCCSQERVAIYNRYVAPLLVCARCRECIDERDSPNRSSGNPPGSTGDVRYTGVSLRFTGRESELEPEFELDPSGQSHDRWGTIGTSTTRRSSGGVRRKRRTQSDPPPMLGLAFSSSGDDSSSSGADIAPGARTKHHHVQCI